MPPPVDPNQPKYRWDFENAAQVTSILRQTVIRFTCYASGFHQGSEPMTGNVVLYISSQSIYLLHMNDSHMV